MLDYKKINDHLNSRQQSRLQKAAAEPCICTPCQLCMSCIAKSVLEELKRFSALEDKVDKIINGIQ